MVSERSSPTSSSILHHFIVSNSLSNQNQFQSHHFDSYNNGPIDPISDGSYPHSVILSRSVEVEPQLSANSNSPLMDFLGTTSSYGASHHAQQRLSLSLGSDPTRQRPPLNQSCFVSDDYSFAGVESLVSTALGSSKYLKPAQSLLEEIVSVGGKEIDIEKYIEKLSRENRKGSHRLSAELKKDLSGQDLLSEKHQTHVDLLNLFSLLEEVETRYEEYCHKMEVIVTSFEVVAGLGSGKSYTALALQAMSKHFLKLRNALVSQIKIIKQRIDKETPKISSSLSELTLLELGIMRNSRQAWRPIRGLPESSVTILRSWLFEHFLHPYPSDSEKLMLASQTGLSKNQVSNWFINARVRLWKPMIEEMYRDEFREDDSNESDQLL